jgi:hypothetical protein
MILRYRVTMTRKFLNVLSAFFILSIVLYSCRQPDETANKPVPKQRKAPATLAYHFAPPKTWADSNHSVFSNLKNQRTILAVNRLDSANFFLQDSVLIPGDLTGDLEFYLPFPFTVPAISGVKKVIFFSYPAQAFGAYENGELIYTGPTNMGRKHDPTPTGLFYTNWKAEETTSTFNDEWDLRWNFNIDNKLGVGWHQYAMPGYPASHSCMRLQEWDARFLYDWADQWVVDKNENFELQGTPVIIFGAYNFDAPRPWLSLANNPDALKITDQQLSAIAAPYLPDIMKWQKLRTEVASTK